MKVLANIDHKSNADGEGWDSFKSWFSDKGEDDKGLSNGAKVGIGVASVAAVGGLIALLTGKKDEPNNSTTTNNTTTTTNGKGLSTGAIVAISIGGVAVLGLITFLALRH